MRADAEVNISTPRARRRQTRLLVVCIVLLAIGLRIWGIDYGLPYVYHPDEPRYVGIFLRMFKKCDPNPEMFNYPSLFFYVNTAAYVPYYIAGRVIGTFEGLSDIRWPRLETLGVGKTSVPSTFLLGRGVSCLFSVGGVVLAFLIGRQLTGHPAVGVFAALMTAISPTVTLHGRYIMPDSFVMFFVLLAFYCSVQVFQYGHKWQYIAAGVAIGLAASSKYNGSIIGITLVVAHFLRRGRAGLKDPMLLWAIILSGVAFVLTTPYAVFDFEHFFRDMRYEAIHYSKNGHPGSEGHAFVWYLSYMWKTEGPIVALALFEIIRGFVTRSKEKILLASFPVVYFVFISSFLVHAHRILMPMLPFLFLLASWWLVDMFLWIKEKKVQKIVLGWSAALAMAALLIIPVFNSVHKAKYMASPDSREEARIWIDEHIEEHSKIVIEGYTSYIDREKFKLKSFNRIVDKELEWYVDNGYRYAVFSERMFQRYFREPEKYSDRVRRYTRMFDTLELIKSFDDEESEIRIYRFPGQLEDTAGVIAN